MAALCTTAIILFVSSCSAQTHYHSCAAIYKSNILSQSGVYTLYNRQDQPFQVYCDFYRGYGYTYISPATTVTVNIDDLYTDSKHVLVRDMRKDGSQYEAKIEQITAFQNTPLSIQYNTHSGYQEVQNPKMTPYVYVGFLPAARMRRGQTEGYKLNGKDQTYVNCDGNTNNYFAFLFNQNHAAASPYHPTYSVMQHNWVDTANQVSQSKKIPANFFSFFEMHFGGCGAYGTPQHIQQVSGAALGLRYDITCKTPADIANGTKTVSGTTFGNTVTYTCDVGYGREFGDMTRTCSETGRWTGLTPSCAAFPCSSHPCHNGGLCFEVEGSTFVCECPEGFQGKLCETSAGK
ncbi:uncharacterized protein LOC123537110 [Mercenaria mercenaria]|uniref:uncharacterized protein LOC123537110 n=1 Tax=Mercenaria mercenaria TaxID=6596 RepID=UPI00234F9685|nr:uncharacterized protein LOC123537110 [Mercenaria mercenaria]